MPEKTKTLPSNNNKSNPQSESDENEKDRKNGDGESKSGDSFGSKYKVLAKIGEGSYSEVLKCRHRETGIVFACKRLKHSYRGWKRVNEISEVVTLRKLPRHPNVLQMIEIHYNPAPGRVSLIFELMEMNLYELIKDRKRLLSESRVRVFMFQLMRALRHLHKNGIFHRDVKPENILLDTKSDILKLGDLGSVRGLYSKPPYTEYISTRWYRSPECLLTCGFYNFKMDVWAAGCVFYEILTLRPLFPGSSELDQIGRIHQMLGPPPPKILKKLAEHSEVSKKIILRSSKPGRRDSITKILVKLQCSSEKNSKNSLQCGNPRKYFVGIEKLLPNHVNREAIDLLRMMLQYDPDNRPTSHSALQHPYFDEMKNTAQNVVNQINYTHPLLNILGSDFLQEVKEEDNKSHQNLDEEYNNNQPANPHSSSLSSDEKPYKKIEFEGQGDKGRRRRKLRRKNSLELARKNYIEKAAEDSDSSSSYTKPNKKNKVTDPKPKISLPEKQLSQHHPSVAVSFLTDAVKIGKDGIKIVNLSPYREGNKDNALGNGIESRNEMKSEKIKTGTIQRPPLPPVINSTVIKANPLKRTLADSQMSQNSSRLSYRSLSHISLLEDYPQSVKETLTKSDLQKINDGRRMVQMLPIGKTDIRKSTLSTDVVPPSPFVKTSQLNFNPLKNPNYNGGEDSKISGILSQRPFKSSFAKAALQNLNTIKAVDSNNNIPSRKSSLADRLKSLYPVTKHLEAANSNDDQIDGKIRRVKFECNARNVVASPAYKLPTHAFSDLKYVNNNNINQDKLNSTDNIFKIAKVGAPDASKKRIPQHPGHFQSPVSNLVPDNADRMHRLQMRNRQDLMMQKQLEKYKSEMSPYSKFYVVDDASDIGKSEHHLNNASGTRNDEPKRLKNLYLDALNNNKAQREAKLNVNRKTLKFGDNNQDKTFHSSMAANILKINLDIPNAIPHSQLKDSASLNDSGLSKVDVERHRVYLRRRQEEIEKYKNEMSPYSKLYVVDEANSNANDHLLKNVDKTGAGNVAFPRNRFGDRNEVLSSNRNNLSKDYSNKYPSKKPHLGFDLNSKFNY